MKYTTASVLAAVAGTAAADGWADWSSTTTTTTTSKWVDPTTSSTWADWSSTTSSKPVDPTSSTWGDWSASSSTPVKASTSANWGGWSSSKDGSKASTTAAAAWGSSAPAAGWGAPAAPSTVTVTKTETSTQWGATTTVYRSTVYVGPGPASTVYTCASGAPAGPAAGWPSSSVAAASKGPDASWAAPSSAAATSAGWAAPSSAAPASSPAAAGWGPGSSAAASSKTSAAGWGASPVDASTVTVVPTAGPSGSWGADAGWGSDGLKASGSVLASGGDAGWDWTAPSSPDATYSSAAPTYTGWGDWSGEKGGGSNGTGPAPGTDLSNCTKPWEPLPEANCNGPNSRSSWCNGFDIDTDYYHKSPDTGVVCKYDLVITNTTLALDGISRPQLAVNGQVPGPLIECNWGDQLFVTVTNELQNEPMSIHWHGITQKEHTNDQDGVPGVTECPIAPGSSRVYSFKLEQYGTGWYHSHVLAQLGDGIRGPMVIHGPATANYDIDAGTVMIDDNFGNATNPLTAEANNKIISHSGPGATFNYLLNGANTSPDLSTGKHSLWKVQPGKKYRFRIINSASQNMWAVHFDNHKMTVIATDYVPITPYETEWLNIALGQRYDVIVEMNQAVAGYFLRAVAQTGCPSGSVNNGLGSANGIFLYEGADAVLPTSTAGNKTITDFAYCLDEPIASLVPHLKKAAGTSSAFQASASTLPAGNVARVATNDDGTIFQWFLNNGAMNINYTQPTLKTLAETGDANSTQIANKIILATKNQWVYFVIANQFFASHPIHLHGHDLSLLGQGTTPWSASLVSTLNFDNPPRRDTALLVGSKGVGFPPGYTVIGFETDNPGAWLMHCHIVWHVDGGLALEWIERPSDIKPYNLQPECAAMSTFQAAHGPSKASWESGLKRRSPYFEDLLNARSESVVRRSETSEKRYIDSYVRRGLGDGFKPRRHGLR